MGTVKESLLVLRKKQMSLVFLITQSIQKKNLQS